MASYKDYKSISAAKKAGSMYYTDKNGKKALAVTKEQLDSWKKKNKGKFKGSALTAWANAKGKNIEDKKTSTTSTTRPKAKPSVPGSQRPPKRPSQSRGPTTRPTMSNRRDAYLKRKEKAELEALNKQKRKTDMEINEAALNALKAAKKKTTKKKSPRGAMDKAPAGHGFELSSFTTLMGQKRKTALDRFAPDAADNAQIKRNMSKITKAEWSAMTMKQRKDVGLPTTELQIKRRSGLSFKDFK